MARPRRRKLHIPRFRLRRKLAHFAAAPLPTKPGVRLCGGPDDGRLVSSPLSRCRRCSARPAVFAPQNMARPRRRKLHIPRFRLRRKLAHFAAAPLPTKPGVRLCGGPDDGRLVSSPLSRCRRCSARPAVFAPQNMARPRRRKLHIPRFRLRRKLAHFAAAPLPTKPGVRLCGGPDDGRLVSSPLSRCRRCSARPAVFAPQNLARPSLRPGRFCSWGRG